MKNKSWLEYRAAFWYFEHSYQKNDDEIHDDYFESLMDALDEFGIAISFEQKLKVGKYLLDKYESEIEEYRDYLIECERESLEEDLAKERERSKK